MATVELKTRSGQAAALDDTTIDSLRSRLRGPLLRRDDGGYEDRRRLWNGMIDRRPGLIACCTGASDVIACVQFARDHGLRLAVRGGGHNVAGLAVCDEGLVIDLSAMRGVRVDPARRIVTVQGGATLGDVDHETQAFGLAVPFGVVSATGVAGLTLHGGFGWLSRRHGLTIDNLLAADVVTADGKLRRVSADSEADLFWALRGGGGNFGVVTAFEFQAHPVGPDVWQLLSIYPAGSAERVLQSFSERMAGAPDELTAIAILWSAPELPEIPKEAWGAPVLVVIGCYCGPLEQGEEVLEPFRSLANPIVDLSSIVRFIDLQKSLDHEYPDGRLYYWKSLYIDRFDAEAIRILTRYAAERPSPLTSLDIWALGGVPSRMDASATAFGRRNAPFLLGIESNWDNPDDSKANVDWSRRLYAEMQRFSNGGSYLNFPGFAEEGENMVRASYAGNYERLRALKATYDPENLFSGNLNIIPKG